MPPTAEPLVPKHQTKEPTIVAVSASESSPINNEPEAMATPATPRPATPVMMAKSGCDETLRARKVMTSPDSANPLSDQMVSVRWSCGHPSHNKTTVTQVSEITTWGRSPR